MRTLLKPRLPYVLLATVLLLVAFGTWLYAAGEAKTVQIDAERVVGKTKSEITYQKAVVTQEDAKFSADTIVQRSQNNVHVFTGTGNPVFTDPETKITSMQVVAQSTPRMATFTDNVVMVITPKKKKTGNDSNSELSRAPSTIKSPKLTYDYANKKAFAIGGVVIEQKELGRTVWADQATYDQGTELVMLQGNVRMQNAGEGEVRELKNADKVTVSLETDWIDILALPGQKVQIILEVEQDEPSTKK